MVGDIEVRVRHFFGHISDTALGSSPSWQQTKTDPRPQVVQKNYRSRPDRRITHIQREMIRQCNLTRLLSMPRNLARADCTCKSQNEICHVVTILIGERLAVLTVRRSTFQPAEGNSKAGKPTNCNVKLWFVLDTCCTSSLSSTQLHIETQKRATPKTVVYNSAHIFLNRLQWLQNLSSSRSPSWPKF